MNYQDYIQGTEAILPYGLSHIDANAFASCTSLTNVEIPNSVTEIGEGAFRECTGLTSIEIPESVTQMGEEAFKGCAGLTRIKLHIKEPSVAQDLLEATLPDYQLRRITLYTPIGTGYAYRHNWFFSKFKEVIPKL